ncbi:hypothetical protein [Mucilaginibacter paludis]|uniref:DUF4890 domain-containing protein n=1 Tax=Mucilaginibacter paludis DSM 18603 TaxID=714943 RepID=H1YCW5_9SPHI|nr:hypothetical protein [Mucilaginibacter paludis]EHQ25136.1 hypothetical protein Mucpa_0961 [Mucilaginibacter paludis DSM 18603]
MKKAIHRLTAYLAVAMLFMAQATLAQDAAQALKSKTPEQRAAYQTTLMKTKLQLDTNQVVKVQAINLKYALQFDPILKGDGGRMAKFRQAMSIQKAKDADLKTALTADQYKLYQQYEAEMKEKLKSFASKQ